MSAALSSFLVLLAVIVSIPLVLWLVKRLSQLPGGPGHGPLSLPASISVGPRERIAVLKVGERLLLVGITSQSINLLTELDGPLELPATAGHQGFDALFKRLQHKPRSAA